jgi:GNAT superfamily N-acetyltransferase
MRIRQATEADVPGQDAVFRAAVGELFRRHSFSPPDPPAEAFAAQQRHLIRHDGERCFVAEDAGRVVGFAAAFVRDEAWFLASLFVLPEVQGRGLGRRLLERAWGPERRVRLTMTDSIQPVSNGLYARLGLVPTAPVLALAGTPAADAHAGIEAAPPEPEALRELDLAAYGFDRTVDHAYWQGHARATLWLRAGAPAAYSYAVSPGWIGPVAGLDGEAAAAALRAELARFQGRVRVLVPGSCPELVETALAAGLELVGPPGLLLLSRGAPVPRSLAPGGYALF